MDLYIERIKNKLQQAVDSGMLNEQQTMAAIDDTLDSLLVYKKDDPNFVEVIKAFHKKNMELNKDLINLSKKINDNYTNIYEHIIKDEY